MVNIRSRKCLKCCKDATFAIAGERRALYCLNHKLEDMVDVRHKSCTCIQPNCPKRATYNLPSETKALYCFDHKSADMEDVLHALCDECTTRANYGKPGHEADKCSQHIKPGMIVDPRKRCGKEGCNETAIMGSRLSHAEFCEIHAPETYFCLLNEKCKGCDMINIVDKEGYCNTCHPETIKSYRLAKQRQVVTWLGSDEITKDYKSVDQVLDQTKYCDSNKYRPDIVYQQKEGYVIIVEVDEHQHNTDRYKKCDLPRMINLHSDLMQPTYIIRYNPDEFTKNGKKCKVSDAKRRGVLLDWVKWTKEYASDDKVNEGLHVLYLFYDEYDGRKCKWETIDYTKA